MSLTYDKRRTLHDSLKHLVKSEYEQIFRILKKHNAQYMENSNGIFFDIMTLSDEALDDMLRFIEYCNEVRRQEQSRISEMTELTAEVNLLGEGVAKEPQTA
jgi:hypothetical protein